ncbi:MAG: hypothetical protein LBU44_00605 [Mediterranea sp.]|jgi:hypothetical protein|nr:hypothetical protein [Mediterranea sp.]
MMKKEINLFKLYRLRLEKFLEMAHLIFNNALSPAKVQTLGVGKPYGNAQVSFNKLEDNVV